MERDIYRQLSDSLVRQITEERERFVSAWQEGARTPELNEIGKNIQQLNDLLWQTILQPSDGHESLRSGNGAQSDLQKRGTPLNGRP